MRNIVKILILSLILISCGTQKKVTNDVKNVSVTEEVVVDTIISRSIYIDNPIIDSNIVDINNLTQDQFDVLNNTNSIHKREVYFLEIGGDSIVSDVIIYGNETKILITMDDILKINQTYRLVDILEKLVDKYSIENEFNFTIVSSLNQEISMLSQKVTILNNSISNKDRIISNLESTIEELKVSNSKCEDINQTLGEEVEFQKDQVKKYKGQRNWVAAGSGIILILIVLLAF